MAETQQSPQTPEAYFDGIEFRPCDDNASILNWQTQYGEYDYWSIYRYPNGTWRFIIDNGGDEETYTAVVDTTDFQEFLKVADEVQNMEYPCYLRSFSRNG